MDASLALFGILGALLLGAISPGPSFVFVARTSIARSRRDGLAAAAGMGLGGAIFGSLALLGLIALLAQVEWLYAALKLLGGSYLLYLAFALWRGAKHEIVMPKAGARRDASPHRSFALALMTQLSNPKTAIVYSGIFVALLPVAPPPWMVAILPGLILLVEAGWYSLVALAFSSGRPRRAYLRSKKWADRAAGSAMGLLGLKLVLEAGHPG